MSNRYKKLPSKSLFLSGEIDTNSIMNCVEDIFEINEFAQFYDDDEPIKMVINSPGGSVYDGFALIGMMETSVIPIHTFAYGQIMSMALPIFAAGDVRYCSPYTTFMYHNIAWGTGYEKIEYHKQELKEGERLQAMFDEVLLRKTKLPKKTLDNVIKTKSEWYFSSTEAKKFRVVDKIL